MDYLIYLAGPITGLNWEQATKWRTDLTERFKDASTGRINYITLSPLRGKEYLKQEKNIKDSYANYVMSTPKSITERDLNDVRRSDLIIVNFLGATKVSIGTVFEIGAARALNIPIILIIEDPIIFDLNSELVSVSNYTAETLEYVKRNIHDHSMIRESATTILSNIDDVFEVSLHLLGT